MIVLDYFRPARDVPPLVVSREELDRTYRYWRTRILSSSIIGYAFFYLVRVNIPVAVPEMEKSLHLNHADMGKVLTGGLLVYGISKFFNGFLGDRTNPRFFMPLGLLCSAIMNFCCGLSAGIGTLAIFWILNGWFQGMGFPPCARNVSYWFSPRERSFAMGLWNSGHQIGAAAVFIITGYVIKFGWQWCFIVPAGIAMLGSLFIVYRLRDTPTSLGLPPIETYKGEETLDQQRIEQHGELTQREFVMRYVFGSFFVWLVSFCNFFVYTLRYAALNWGPTFLKSMKGLTSSQTGWLQAGSEMFGLIGAITAGWVVDRYLRGKAGRACFAAMIGMAVTLFLFWKTPAHSRVIYSFLFMFMGFLVYIPQSLIAVMAMNISTKRAAATAVGLTGIFGYASSLLSGWGVGKLVDLYGWDAPFKLMILCALITAALFLITWNLAPEHPPQRGFPVITNDKQGIPI